MLTTELGEHGCNCEIARDGEEALQKINKTRYQIVFLDIRLPGISGIDILMRTEKLRQNNVGTIMITAIDEVDTAVKAMKLGANDYIVKPLNITRVLLSIAYTLQAVSSKDRYNKMDAIACGVEEKLEIEGAHSRKVIEGTATVARQLGISEHEIESWIYAREQNLWQRTNRIQTALTNLYAALSGEILLNRDMLNESRFTINNNWN